MRRLTCPKCDTAFKPEKEPRAGKKVRCPECEHAFVPELDDEDADASEEPTKSEGKKKGANKKKKASPMMLALVLGGGVALLGCCVCGVGVGYFTIGSSILSSVDVSRETYGELPTGLTIAETELFMKGAGQRMSSQEAQRLIAPGPGGMNRAFDRNVFGDPVVVYRKGGRHIFVGFVASPKYGELSFSKSWYEVTSDSSMWASEGGHGLNEDATRDRLEKATNDPKWKAGPENRKRLIGKWDSGLTTYEFKADGSLIHSPKFPKRDDPGTYQFIDDRHIKLTHAATDFEGVYKVTRILKVQMTDNELMLVTKLGEGKYAPTLWAFKRSGK